MNVVRICTIYHVPALNAQLNGLIWTSYGAGRSKVAVSCARLALTFAESLVDSKRPHQTRVAPRS
jgi:hypothetical protein